MLLLFISQNNQIKSSNKHFLAVYRRLVLKQTSERDVRCVVGGGGGREDVWRVKLGKRLVAGSKEREGWGELEEGEEGDTLTTVFFLAKVKIGGVRNYIFA